MERNRPICRTFFRKTKDEFKLDYCRIDRGYWKFGCNFVFQLRSEAILTRATVGDSIERIMKLAKKLGLKTALPKYCQIGTENSDLTDYELSVITDLLKIV